MTTHTVGAILLAAGRGRRMGCNKLLEADAAGRPLVAIAAAAVCGSRARPVVAVIGPAAAGVGAALDGFPLVVVPNPDPDAGLSSSLRCGLVALPSGVDAVVVCLADMPGVRAAHINALIDAFDPGPQASRDPCAVACGGRRGNPVLWGRPFFPALMTLAGDQGARGLLRDHPPFLVETGDPGVLLDIDTPDALARWRRRAAGSGEQVE